MTMRQSLILLGILFSSVATIAARAAAVASEPFLVETKVQVDIENALARLLQREQFLVQVNTEVGTRVERRLVEGETVTTPPVPTNPPVMNMPGFLPEPDIKPLPAPPQLRETYRVIETPTLNSVMVHVSFDDAVAPETFTRGKIWCSNTYATPTRTDR